MSAEHQPTTKTRDAVEMLVASGIQQQHVAGVLGISVPTLKRHYSEELELGKAKKLAAVAATVFQAAVGRPARFDERNNKTQSEIKPNLAAAFFILKCQGGWKETNVVEVVDPSAGARERLAREVDRCLTAIDGEGGAAADAPAGLDQQRPN